VIKKGGGNLLHI